MKFAFKPHKSLLPLLTLTLFSVLATACGNSSSKGTDTADSATAPQDSLVAETSKIAELPDTIFDSAKVLVFNVDMRLDSISPRITDLTDLYAENSNQLTFRGSSRRDAPMAVTVNVEPTDIVVDWKFTTDMDKVWGGGSGWTGQPVVVTWPDQMVSKFRQAGLVTPDFEPREVIVGSLDGSVYFINPKNGKASRNPIATGNPIKGSVSLDPWLNGLLYVGQGIPNISPFGAVTIDLTQGRIIDTFDRDPKAQRGWHAYDSSAVRLGDFVFRPGENGSLYKWYAPQGSAPKLHSVLRYTKAGVAPGIEASMAIYANYGYLADNHGNIVCVNLNTMLPVWAYDNHDDTDASPIVAVEQGKPYVYVASETDRQGTGYAYLAKLNALDGQQVWEFKTPAKRFDKDDKHFDGGFYATPLLGRGNAADLLFANVVYNLDGQNGALIAIDRNTGEQVWQTPLTHYAWSSPVAVMAPDNKMYILDADCFGFVYLINATNGEIVTRRQVGSNFESSPAVYDDKIVVGSRGNLIFQMTIK